MKTVKNKIKKEENFGVAVIVLHPENNKILLGERQNSYGAGFHGLPGGRVNFDEPLEKAAIRELLEETNLNSNRFSYLGVIREQQEGYTFIHFGYIVKNFSGNLQNMEPEKCKGWNWFELKNLPAKILPGHKALIDIFTNSETESIRDIFP